MSIEANYINKINEIEKAPDTLSSFETKFIFGDDQGRPIRERDSLSDKQKAIIDRIYKERVMQVSREEASVVDFGNDRVKAIQVGGQKAYSVVLDGNQVGPVVNSGEAVNVVSWISACLTGNLITLTANIATGGDTAEQPAKEEVAGFPGE